MSIHVVNLLERICAFRPIIWFISSPKPYEVRPETILYRHFDHGAFSRPIYKKDCITVF